MNCTIKWCLKALAGEGGGVFLSPNELSSSIFKSTKLRLEEDSDLLPTRGYEHMLKHSAKDFSTTFAKMSPKISNFTDCHHIKAFTDCPMCYTHHQAPHPSLALVCAPSKLTQRCDFQVTWGWRKNRKDLVWQLIIRTSTPSWFYQDKRIWPEILLALTHKPSDATTDVPTELQNDRCFHHPEQWRDVIFPLEETVWQTITQMVKKKLD